MRVEKSASEQGAAQDASWELFRASREFFLPEQGIVSPEQGIFLAPELTRKQNALVAGEGDQAADRDS